MNMESLFAAFIFGAIGFAAFIYGKKQSAWRPMVLGFALMAYPYFITDPWPTYLVGLALTAALFLWKE